LQGRGDEIYESQIRAQVEEGNHGKIVAIDLETGAFEVADSFTWAAPNFRTSLMLLFDLKVRFLNVDLFASFCITMFSFLT
jgi:hypothetical protein